jgi:hypothetical protein
MNIYPLSHFYNNLCRIFISLVLFSIYYQNPVKLLTICCGKTKVTFTCCRLVDFLIFYEIERTGVTTL